VRTPPESLIALSHYGAQRQVDDPGGGGAAPSHPDDPGGGGAVPSHPDDPGDVGAVPPRLADGLELLGEMASSGHRRPPSLVRRADGQTIQVTSLLYRTLEAIDGRRDHGELARVVGERVGRAVAPEDIEYLVSSKLRPLGVLQEADGSQPATSRANPLLALRLRTVMSDPALTDRLAAPFTPLFRAPVMLAVVAGFAALVAWLFLRRGMALAVREAFYEPGLLLAVFALTIGSAAFHELGHAAACRYGGGRPGAMGAGLYLVWPAFYTDVSDAYRLSRRARLRVDLGGIYFNAIFALGAFALWWVTGLEALLLVVPLQVFQMVRQLVPLVRLDGYHILADLTGVPDLFAHIKPILLGMLPTRWGRPESRVLRPWVRAVVTIWVLVVVPLLLAMLVMIVVVLPRLAATAWDSLGLEAERLRSAWADQDVLLSSVRILSMIAIALPVLSMTYLLARVVRRTTRRAWRATEGRPPHRVGLVVGAVAVLLALTAVWWPNGQYRPIVGDERGTVADLLGPIPAAPIDTQLAGTSRIAGTPADGSTSTSTSSPGGQVGASSPPYVGAAVPSASAVAPAPTSAPQPDARRQRTTPAPSAPGADHPRSERTQPTERERVAFNVPEPREGDNFAVAENHTDGTAVLDFAVSLVFVDGEEPDSTREERIEADNRNRAYALANCADCAAIAVAYQVVIIVGQVDVIIPENLAVALNVFCDRCTSFAMAIQLVVTINAPLSDEGMAELEAVWAQLDEIRDGIATGTINAAELQEQLLRIEGEILQVLADDGVLTWSSGGVSSTAEDGSPPEPVDETTTTSTTSTSTSTTSTTSTSTTTSTTTEPLAPGSGEESAAETDSTQSLDDSSSTTTAPPSSGTETTDPDDGSTTTSTTSPSSTSEDEEATG
jgi:putative peptide zinc metalloprotease protein